MEEHAPFRAVIFDFDYTLADSSSGVVDCVNHALARMGLPPHRAETIRPLIGMSLEATFARLIDADDGTGAEAFKRLFLERAGAVMVDAVCLYSSTKACLETLRDRGLLLGIVSTKYRHRIQQVVEREGMDGLFSGIVGGEDVAVHKPDPAGLNEAVERLAIAPGEVLYVGDSTVDAETARRAGIAFVAVLTGVTPREAFAGFQPCAVIDDLSALPGLVTK